MAQRKRAVLWFRNDLRLSDNPALHAAVQCIKAGDADEVLPVYCFDPRYFRATPWGHPKTGPARAQFLVESVHDLRQRLRSIGSDLWLFAGKPEDVLPELAGGRGVVLAQAEVCSEERAVEKKVHAALGASGGALTLYEGAALYHPADLPFQQDLSDMPDVFTPFKQKVEQRCQVRPLLPPPAVGELPPPPPGTVARPQLEVGSVEALNAAVVPPRAPRLATPAAEPRGVLAFKGGETAALARLRYYLWDSDLLATYFDTRNGMLGGDYSTKFSPWLAHGCLSPRTIYHEIQKYERMRTKNKSTYWVVFELTWRDFYRAFAQKHGNKIFQEDGVVGAAPAWSKDPERWARWRDGNTGWPLVDANMRELKATGFMSNRGRQNVASFLVLDLGHDWRQGADWFESQLLDYDPTSNWGNWVAAAGLTGGRINKFNITKQSKDYDPQGDYLRTWLPELAKLPASRIHEPWTISREEQQRYGLQLGVDYPNPLKSSFKGYPSGGGGSGGGRGGSFKGSSGGYRKGQGGRGSGGAGGRSRSRPKSNFEMYG